MKSNSKTSTTVLAALARVSAHRIVMLVAALTLAVGTVAAAPQLTSSATEDAPLALVYVPGVSGGITEINSADNVVIGTAPWAHGSNGGIVVTPDDSRVYVSGP